MPCVTDQHQPTRLGDAPADEGVPEDAASPARPLWRRRSVLVAGALLVVSVVLYIAAYLALGHDLVRGATVLGVPVGGLTRAEAEAKLAADLPAVADAPIAVRVTDGEETFNLVPPESGLGIDIEATVGAVPRASANPFSLVRALFGAGAA